jgi:hypothetical protein
MAIIDRTARARFRLPIFTVQPDQVLREQPLAVARDTP